MNWAFSDILELAPGIEIFEIFSDFCFMADFFVKFMVAKKDARTGLLITKKRILWYNYFTSIYFWVDFITCVPIDRFAGWSMGLSSSELDEISWVTFIKFARIIRIYRMAEIPHFIEEMDQAKSSWFFFSAASHYLKLLILLVFVLTLSHYGGCFWYSVAWVGGDSGWNFWKHRAFCDAMYEDQGFALDALDDASLSVKGEAFVC